jgi:hypothetical protein
MRYSFILGATALVTACNGVTFVGKGFDNSRGGTDADGGLSQGGDAAGRGAAGGSGAGGASAGGSSAGRGNAGGTGGAKPCSGAYNCPLIKPCPTGQMPVTPPGQCCPTECAPAGSGGASGGECKSAADCAVPAVCKVCADGSSSCAQGGCANGQCTTTFPPCPSVDAGAACKVDGDCPKLGIACKLCPDGTSACPFSHCIAGQCMSGVETCPGSTDLKWFATCGPPVCRAPDVPTGAPICDPTKGQTVGGACSPEGATCDPGGSCQGNLVCALKDPRSGAGCPISRAKYKQDIEYLSHDERQSLANELQSIPLVRYRYKEGPAREHLGFIIEDVEPSPSVDSQRDQVDLYGYTSMAVAALQQQHAEIETLKKQVKALEAALGRRAKGN